MKIERSKEWWLAKALAETGHTVGAGRRSGLQITLTPDQLEYLKSIEPKPYDGSRIIGGKRP